MPDVAGRRRAVSVAIFSPRSIVVGHPDRAQPRQPRPPESTASCTPSGRSSRVATTTPATRTSGAYGKYQIMPSNWPGWAKLYIGSSTAPQTPANQEKVARGKVTALYNWLDTLAQRRPLVADRVGRAEPGALVDATPRLRREDHEALQRGLGDDRRADVGVVPPPLPVGVVDVTTAGSRSQRGDRLRRALGTASHAGYTDGRVHYSERTGRRRRTSSTRRAWRGSGRSGRRAARPA